MTGVAANSHSISFSRSRLVIRRHQTAGGTTKTTGGGAADIVAALGDNPEERLAAARSSSQPIEASVLSGAAFLVGKSLRVIGLLELLATIPGAGVRGDDVVAFGDAHFFEIGEDDERPLHPVVGTE